MIVVGFDPGAVHTGWAALRFDGAQATYLDGGVMYGWTPGITLWLFIHDGDHAERIDLVAVEIVAGYSHGERAHAKSKHLIEASRRAGELVGMAAEHSVATMAVPASTWRKALTSNPCASDALVRSLVCGRVFGLPKRHNPHVRDAIGVALYAADTKRIAAMARRSA